MLVKSKNAFRKNIKAEVAAGKPVKVATKPAKKGKSCGK
jgi:hypothetical protein